MNFESVVIYFVFLVRVTESENYSEYDTETEYGEDDYTDEYDYTNNKQDTTECECVSITLKDENSGKIYDLNL